MFLLQHRICTRSEHGSDLRSRKNCKALIGQMRQPTRHTYTWLDRLLARYQLEAIERWTFPPRRGAGVRLTRRLAADVLAMVLRNHYPGDILCVLVRRC